MNNILRKSLSFKKRGFLISVTKELNFEALEAAEKEILEDLVVAAVNKAISSAAKLAEEEMAKVTKGMIPPGMNIPGL